MGFNSEFKGLKCIKSLHKFIATRLNPFQVILRKILASLQLIKKTIL